MASSSETSSALDRLEDYVRRILGLFSVLVDMHLEVAVREANYEGQRLLGGVILLSLGVGLLAIAGTLLQGVAICFVHSLGLSWMSAIAAVAGGNAVLGLMLLLLGLARLRGPVMVQTQARVARSVALLRGRD